MTNIIYLVLIIHHIYLLLRIRRGAGSENCPKINEHTNETNPLIISNVPKTVQVCPVTKLSSYK